MGLSEEGKFYEHGFTPKAPIEGLEGYASGGGPAEFVQQDGSSDPGFKPLPFESEGAGSKYSEKQG